MMTYDEFCEKVKKDLLELLPDDYQNAEIVVESIKKNNGLIYEGISARMPGENISPIVYLNSYYEQYLEGTYYPEVVDNIAGKLVKYKVADTGFEISKLLDYEYIKDKLTLYLCNYEKNISLLEEVPHEIKGDYALIVKCQVARDEESSAGFTIKNSHLKAMNVTKEQLFKDAYISAVKLMPPELKSMKEVLQSVMPGFELDDVEPAMYVLTNIAKSCGAACLFYPGLMEEIGKQLKSDFHIIPSSVHECIIITGDFTSAHIQEMITEVNDTQVDPLEVLGTRPSTYDIIQKEIIPMCEYEDHIREIREDIVKNGYKPTNQIINGIRLIEKKVGIRCELKDMYSLAKMPEKNAEVKKTLDSIFKQFKLQEMKIPKL